MKPWHSLMQMVEYKVVCVYNLKTSDSIVVVMYYSCIVCRFTVTKFVSRVITINFMRNYYDQ